MRNDPILTVAQAAERLQTSEQMVRRLLREGRLVGVRLGGTKAGWRIQAGSIDELVMAWRRQAS